jgi:hypothetical protein
MHFRLPLQVRKFVHLVGPHRCIQLKAASDGDDFLPVGHAPRANYAWHGHAFRFAHIFRGHLCAATGAIRRLGRDTIQPHAAAGEAVGFANVAPRIVLRVAIRAGPRSGFGVGGTSSIERGRFHRRFLAASRANIFVFAERNLQRGDQCFFVRAETLGVRDVAHVGAELAIGPQKITDGGEQFLDLVVLLDQVRDVAGRARRRNIVQRLRRLRIKAHARHVLRKHGHKRKAKSLIKIGDELIARHFFKLTIVAGARFVRQMPVHIVRIPPAILLALPEKPRLTNTPNLVAPRGDAFGAILPHQFTQGADDLGLHIVEQFVVWA